MCYSIFDYRGKIQLNFSQTGRGYLLGLHVRKETSHELSCGKQLSKKVDQISRIFLKKNSPWNHSSAG